jgi:hypothetical protein
VTIPELSLVDATPDDFVLIALSSPPVVALLFDRPRPPSSFDSPGVEEEDAPPSCSNIPDKSNSLSAPTSEFEKSRHSAGGTFECDEDVTEGAETSTGEEVVVSEVGAAGSFVSVVAMVEVELGERWTVGWLSLVAATVAVGALLKAMM